MSVTLLSQKHVKGARIEYLQAVSQNQVANKKSIQWRTAIISIVIGAAGAVGIYYWMQKSKQPKAIKMVSRSSARGKLIFIIS